MHEYWQALREKAEKMLLAVRLRAVVHRGCKEQLKERDGYVVACGSACVAVQLPPATSNVWPRIPQKVQTTREDCEESTACTRQKAHIYGR